MWRILSFLSDLNIILPKLVSWACIWSRVLDSKAFPVGSCVESSKRTAKSAIFISALLQCVQVFHLHSAPALCAESSWFKRHHLSSAVILRSLCQHGLDVVLAWCRGLEIITALQYDIVTLSMALLLYSSSVNTAILLSQGLQLKTSQLANTGEFTIALINVHCPYNNKLVNLTIKWSQFETMIWNNILWMYFYCLCSFTQEK